jgi:hypothetical protein
MIHLELQPEIEALLAAEAQNRGLPTERYIESLLIRHLDPSLLDKKETRQDLAADAEADEDLRLALEDIARGRTVTAREAFAHLREAYDIRG